MIRRDHRDRLADVTNDVGDEHGLVTMLEAVTVHRHVVGGEHRVHAGDRERRPDVDRPDSGRRMR